MARFGTSKQYVSRRLLTNIVNIAGRPWNDVRTELEHLLRHILEALSEGIPGGFKGTVPQQITADNPGEAGSVNDGWMSAGAIPPILTGPGADVQGTPYTGVDPALARADHGHDTIADPFRMVTS